MKGTGVTIHMVGDLILDEPEPDSYFTSSRDVLRESDFLIGHVEVPHTRRGHIQSTDVPAPPADPDNLKALGNAGFTTVSLAGNHIHDSGPEGIEDTIRELGALGIDSTGAGMNLAEARRPVIRERGSVRLGFLSYNCVGPREGWATSGKAGCAYLRILTHYELDHAGPGSPPSIYTFVHPDSLALLEEDISNLRKRCDVVAVALHKGVCHTRAKIEMYERPVSRAAIDAGADIVIGHHAHILRGIEIYRGKPIYHGLGNFVTVTRALSPKGDNPDRVAWAKKREKLFGFSPDPDMPFYPFHPESRNTMIGRCVVAADGSVEAGFIPCRIDEAGRPVPVPDREAGSSVLAYVEEITREAGLRTSFEWRDGWIAVS